MSKVFRDLAVAVGQTLLHEAGRMAFGLALGAAKAVLKTPEPRGVTGMASLRAMQRKTVDGAVLAGPRGEAWAKFTLKKGLPTPDQPRKMAVENEPHEVNDFDGVIEEGYGKGTKELVYAGNTVVKQPAGSSVGRVNVHLHQAERAGPHYDFVVQGVGPHPRGFEVNIPNGEFKGRYAFRQAFGEEDQYLVVRMVDRSVRIGKPDIHLKPKEFLQSLRLPSNPGVAAPLSSNPVAVEWKADGSLANVSVYGNRAIFRSHRVEGEPYYDKLPLLEDLSNHSPVYLARKLFPGPGLDKSVLRGELFHNKGAAYVGGVLNALPARSIASQKECGPVSFFVWDVARLRGRDVSKLPYDQRRQLYEAAVEDIRLFNKLWSVVQRMEIGGDPTRFYEEIIGRPLPYGEGVVIKELSGDRWWKVKATELSDLKVVGFVEGNGKFKDSLGAMVVEGPTGIESEVGSMQITDSQRQWIWRNRDILIGQVGEFRAQEITRAGAVRAGTFVRFHPSKSTAGLLMYSEALDPDHPKEMMYRLKVSAGWKRNT